MFSNKKIKKYDNINEVIYLTVKFSETENTLYHD